MTKTYTAEYAGSIVGKRTTKDRSYTHAVVILFSREYHRKAAYEYVATETDRSNYNYWVEIAEGRSSWPQTVENVLKASGRIDGGFNAYIERVRAERIANFERMTFEPHVLRWCGRLDLARKAMAQLMKPWIDFAVIVPTVEVTKKAKVA